MGEASLGARLLTTEDDDSAREIARHLDALNRERQKIEQAVLEEAIEQVEMAGDGAPASASLVLAHDERWHAGVIGIVASRLKERYNRPAVVVAWEDGADGVGKALLPLGAGRRYRRCDHRRPPGGAAGQRRRPSDGGRLHRGEGEAVAAGGFPA